MDALSINAAQQAQDTKDQKMSSLETIAATLAHEIKNPLALIKVNLDFIELCDIEKKYHKNYTVMKKEINRANELLLDFGKLFQHGFSISETVNIRDAVQKTIDNYSLYEKIKIRWECGNGSDCYAKGNFDLLSMAFSNVMKNAVEAMEEEGEIIVSLEMSSGNIKITVTDNGCGIGSEALDKLNGNVSVTSKKYGNGLGIILTRKILEVHGGSIKIQNNPERGACVEIYIPRTAA